MTDKTDPPRFSPCIVEGGVAGMMSNPKGSYVLRADARRATPPSPSTAPTERLLAIIAAAYQIAGAHDAPAHILDVLANPEAATDEQVEAMLPYVPSIAPTVDERAAFEAWSRRVAPAYGFDKDERGQYIAYPVHSGWAAWQARAALVAKPATQEAEKDQP
jgi:hypothetical protein